MNQPVFLQDTSTYITPSHSPNTLTELTWSSLFCSLPGLSINNPFNSTQAPVVNLCPRKKKRQHTRVHIKLESIFFSLYALASSLFKMACMPFKFEPSLMTAKLSCFCFRTERIHPVTETCASLVSFFRIDFIVLLGRIDLVE